MGTSATRATVLLTRAGVSYDVRAYTSPATSGAGRHDYGAEAAAALGVPPDSVYKTLVADAGGTFLLALVPVDRQLDLRALASVVGARAAALVEPVVAERLTGYVVGGISPFAPRRQMPTIVDETALRHDRIHVSAGRRGLQVLLDPRDLVLVLDAQVAPISRDG
jgi:Cys-tRNA(Pro)/Cys-tRNA(Cys) deacylase